MSNDAKMSNDNKRPKNPSANVEQPVSNDPKMSNDNKRPKNPSANVLPSEGHVLEIDGKFKSEYATSAAAMKAGVELKKKFPHIDVKVYDAKERTRTPVVLSE